MLLTSSYGSREYGNNCMTRNREPCHAIAASGSYAADAYLAMLEPLAPQLPDMEFVVNLNDEPRVMPGGDLGHILRSACINASAALAAHAPLHGFFTAGWQVTWLCGCPETFLVTVVCACSSTL